MSNKILKYLLLVTGISLASVAAYYSITGLSKLFSGSTTEIIIMASVLEFSKVLITTYLHNKWKGLKFLTKTYLTTSVIVLMLITSLGIYGFIINAYQGTADKLTFANAEVQLIENNKGIIDTKVSQYQEQIDFRNKRINTLSEVRTNQEVRLDSLYKRKSYYSAKRVEKLIEESNKEIQKQTHHIDSLSNKIFQLYADKDSLDREILKIQTEHSSGEIGPLIYLSKITGKDMDSIVNYFVLLFVFVFDPLALSMIIAYNRMNVPTTEPNLEKLRNEILNEIEDEEEQVEQEVEVVTHTIPSVNVEVPVEEEMDVEEHIVALQEEAKPKEEEPPPPPPKPKPPRRGSHRKINR